MIPSKAHENSLMTLHFMVLSLLSGFRIMEIHVKRLFNCFQFSMLSKELLTQRIFVEKTKPMKVLRVTTTNTLCVLTGTWHKKADHVSRDGGKKKNSNFLWILKDDPCIHNFYINIILLMMNMIGRQFTVASCVVIVTSFDFNDQRFKLSQNCFHLRSIIFMNYLFETRCLDRFLVDLSVAKTLHLLSNLFTCVKDDKISLRYQISFAYMLIERREFSGFTCR